MHLIYMWKDIRKQLLFFPKGDALAGAVDARRWSTPNIPAAARYIKSCFDIYYREYLYSE